MERWEGPETTLNYAAVVAWSARRAPLITASTRAPVRIPAKASRKRGVIHFSAPPIAGTATMAVAKPSIQ